MLRRLPLKPMAAGAVPINPFRWPGLMESRGFIAGFGGRIWQRQQQKRGHKPGSAPKSSRKGLMTAHKMCFKESLGHMLVPGAAKEQGGTRPPRCA